MKKSRIAKFALLGASAAALAATLSTSTYAWYVTNNKASITAVNGSTAAASAAGSISLSNSGVLGTFTKDLTLGAFDLSTASLVPVGTTDGKTFKSLNTATGVASVTADIATVGYGAASAGSVYRYSFFILAEGDTASTTTVTPLVTITNTTATNAFKSQVNYSATALTPNTITAGSTFYANALNAMCMTSAKLQGTALVSTLTDADAVTAEYVTGKTTTLNSVDHLSGSQAAVADGNRYATSTTNGFPTGAKIATAGALSYYNAISETDLDTGAITSTSYSGTALGNITLNNMKPMLLEFYLYLDGADDACFNACEQQTFSVAFEFQVA